VRASYRPLPASIRHTERNSYRPLRTEVTPTEAWKDHVDVLAFALRRPSLPQSSMAGGRGRSSNTRERPHGANACQSPGGPVHRGPEPFAVQATVTGYRRRAMFLQRSGGAAGPNIAPRWRAFVGSGRSVACFLVAKCGSTGDPFGWRDPRGSPRYLPYEGPCRREEDPLAGRRCRGARAMEVAERALGVRRPAGMRFSCHGGDSPAGRTSVHRRSLRSAVELPDRVCRNGRLITSGVIVVISCAEL
jgi:hypothetical protein